MASHISVTLQPRAPAKEPPSHWVGNPPTQFRNPWPSFRHDTSLAAIFRLRFGKERNFVPVPLNRDELVNVRKPNWGAGMVGLKATWIGHSSFLVETTAEQGKERGVRALLDPVFCKRMGPTSFTGPTRFSDTPCEVQDLPEVDILCISHNHYDHLDVSAVKALYFDKRRKAPLHVFCGLGFKAWFVSCGISDQHVTEMDWWDEVAITVKDVGPLKLACTPSQHSSRRGPWDVDRSLWCSWVMEEVGPASNRRLFFAGDTGYSSITEDDVASEKDTSQLPKCPAFAEIGDKYGPIDLALLPIGCYSPRTFLSAVHCSPEDSIEIHLDIKSKKSLGMHYGTVRGGISAQYEDVREPPKRWKEACEKRGLKWNDEIFVCDIGETAIIE